MCIRDSNEGDEPRFTQPKLYKNISKHPNSRDIYVSKLIEDGIIGVKDNKISLIESKKENINNLPESKECIRLDNEIIIPGLINAHCHAADSLFRGLVENLSLEDWLQEVWKAE